MSTSRRVRRSLTVVLAVFCVSCSSGSTEPNDAVDDATISTVTDDAVDEAAAPSSTAPQEAAGDIETTEPNVETTESPVAEAGAATISFTNPDGTATFPSRPIFTLTSAETGESLTVPVGANGIDTLTDVDVAPGTYAVSTSGPFIGGHTTYVVSDFGPTEITVGGSGDAGAVVEFSVDAQSAPLELVVDRVDTSSVSLSWNGPDDIAAYVVRRTDGDDPATGPDDGVAVDLDDPTARAAVARDLESEADYTFALFATTAGGEALPIASATASTSKPGGTTAAYALATNTIVPTDFAALEAEQVGESMVRVTLRPGNADRASSSALPGLAAGALDGGCVVGSPFLVSPEVAGGDSFYGLIEACESSPVSGFAPGAGDRVTAIVNTDVALSHIVSYLDLDVEEAFPCSSIGDDGELVEIDESFCSVEGEDPDSDGDGLSDMQEAIWGTDPAATDTDGDRLSDGEEVNEYGTDPLNVDSDFDRLFDEEITFFGTDPLNPDTDGDGCWDHGENVVGRNPLDPDDQGGECFEANWQLEVEQSRAAYEAEQNGPPAIDPDVAPQGFVGHALAGRSLSAPDVLAAPAPRLQTLECESSDESPNYQVIEVVAAVKPDVSGWNKFDGINIGKRSGPSLDWDIKASVDVTLGTKFTFENKLTCALKLPKMNFPIPIAGLPFSLTVEPVVEGFASAKIVIDGPKVGVHFEANSASWISINPLWTGWCKTKTETGRISGKDVEKTFNTCPIFVNPFGTFNIPAPRLTVSAPSVTIEGELGVDIGAKITFGPGLKNSLSGFGAGIGVALIPVAGRAKAAVGSDGACADLSVGGSATAFITATAYIDIGLIKAEEGGTINLFTVDFEYPIPKYQLGECG